MDILQFSRSKRSNVNPSEEDLDVIFGSIDELLDNKMAEKNIESKTDPEHAAMKTEWMTYDSKTKNVINSITSTFANVELLSYYLSEDSKDIIDRLLDNKLIDPYVQCVALSVINQLNKFDHNIEKYIHYDSIDEELTKDIHSQIFGLAWRLVKRQIRLLTGVEYFDQDKTISTQ